MRKTTLFRWLAIVLALGLVASACGSGSDDDDDIVESADTPTAVADDGGDDDAGDTPTAVADDGGDDAVAGVLAGVCPSPLVIQTDWFAEAEHGALYELVGDDYTVDADNLVVSGSMVLGGQDLGIDIEVRSGGPAIGFAAPRVQMYTDDSIHIGYTSTDQQATAWEDLPLISVIAPLEINPQIIMWDADTYPDVKTIADVGEADITVNLFAFGGFAEAFVAQGIWSKEQVDPSYDGGPARFIAEGDIAQQGFASAEPYTYEFVFEEYGKAPAFELLHDAGWQVYSQSLGVKPADLEELRPCLEKFVPIVQQAIIDSATNPARANAIIVDTVEQFDSSWVYSPELADWSVQQQIDLGLVGNGGDDIVGNMDASRIQAIHDAQRASGIELVDGLTAEDTFTNEFIDDSIGFPAGFGPAAAASDSGTDEDAGLDLDLAGVCPSPLVIQTDWFAEAEHGALYELVGDDYTVDADNLVVSGSMVLGGQDLGIDIEVRSGGPAIGFAAPRVQMYTDDSIHIGYTTTDQQMTAWEDLPLISVIAPLEINPQIIMWDADTYPDVKTIADVGEADITVNLFQYGGFAEAFVAQGIWSKEQVDPSYDGGPARFIAEGDIAQQGFASAEPYNYEFVFEEYGKAPAFQLLHDAGWQVYSQSLGVKPADLEELRPCLEKFVPIVQQAIIDSATNPARSNAIIVDTVEQFDSFWVYTPELADWSVQQQIDLGLVGNGGDDVVVGNMDASRIQAIIDAQLAAGIELVDGLTAEDTFTNEFIDESIGF